MEEKVIIALDRYNDLLDDNRKANLLYDIKKQLIEILDYEEFDIDNEIHNKIFKIYSKLCEEI